MNRLGISNSVKSYLNRPKLSNDDISTMIASVEGEFNRELREHPRNMRRTSYIIPTVNSSGDLYTEDTPIIPLPADIAMLVTICDDNGEYQSYPPTVIPEERGFIERGDCLHVYPTPARGSTFYMDYIAFIEALQDDLDTNWISDYYSDLYLYGVLKESAVYLKNDSRLALWEKEFTRRLAGVQGQGWNQNIGSSPQIRHG